MNSFCSEWEQIAILVLFYRYFLKPGGGMVGFKGY